MAVGWANEDSSLNEQQAVINGALASIKRSYHNKCSCGNYTSNVVLCDSCLSARRKKKK